jgi:hypothetical protein
MLRTQCTFLCNWALVLWQMGDVLHAVDGRNVIGMNKMEVANLLMGPEGSKVRLRFLRQEGNGSCYKGGRGIGVVTGILPLMHLHMGMLMCMVSHAAE